MMKYTLRDFPTQNLLVSALELLPAQVKSVTNGDAKNLTLE